MLFQMAQATFSQNSANVSLVLIFQQLLVFSLQNNNAEACDYHWSGNSWPDARAGTQEGESMTMIPVTILDLIAECL